MKYEIFWKVLGGEPGEKYIGSDIIETDEAIDINDADSLASDYLRHSAYKQDFPNLGDAVNNKCVAVCKDWEIKKIKKLNYVLVSGDEHEDY